MKTAKYNKDRDYDELLDSIMSHVKYLITEKDDDFLILCAGDTGTGKSMLMMHTLDRFMNGHKSVEYVGLTKGSFASGFKKVQAVPKGYKFLGNDEANISKRDALSKYNKDLLDLYYSCRGLNIFHWWNNPSVDIIDKPFIKDRVKGFILITTKDKDRPRIYYYFTKNALIKIFEKYKNLDIKTIKKVKGKYATYKGWFKDYNGALKQEYLDKKNPRMIEKVDDFVEKYGDKEDEGLTTKAIADFSGYTTETVRRMSKDGIIPSSFLIESRGSTRLKFKKETLIFLEERKKNIGKRTFEPIKRHFERVDK